MQMVNALQEIRPWCVEAAVGQEEDFSVAVEVTQDEASKLAFEVNQGRDGHVWIGVEGTASAPELTTRVHVRCSA